MTTKASVAVCSIALLLALTFLVGANPARREATRWEYGIYTESPGNFEWRQGNQRAQATNPTVFFEQMGFPTPIEVRTNTGQQQALLLNYLGQQGWELVEVAVTTGQDQIYWFRRPK